jgi:hypothetical protein
MPFDARRESDREVLPWSTWARIHMFRMFCGLFWRVASCWEATAGIVPDSSLRGGFSKKVDSRKSGIYRECQE